jgi:hypothetical protein
MSTIGGNLAGHGRMFVTAIAVVLMSVSGFTVHAADPSEVSRVASDPIIGQSELPTVVVTGEMPLDQASAYDQQHEAKQ